MTGHTLDEAARWIQLLAQEVVTRVERDAARNDRYPRCCNIQYAAAQTQPNHQNNKSIRIPFPTSRLTTAQKVSQLVEAVPKAIRSKEEDGKRKGPFRMHRVGLCTTDFEPRGGCSTHAIESYFGTASSNAVVHENKESTFSPLSVQNANGLETTVVEQSDAIALPIKRRSNTTVVDSDLEFAKKLQASYDRENHVLQVLDASVEKKKATALSRTPKSRRNDNFFQKK
jgi:hypothetical protein